MSKNHILITGLPEQSNSGVGKTTLIKKIVAQLKENNIKVGGFYTEEIRNDSNSRIGFDVVTLEGKRGKLARTTDCVPPNELTRYRVGQYVVFPKVFEALVLPLFEMKEKFFVLDEIGKMELFSDLFKKSVEDAFKSPNTLVLATIPVPKGRPIPLVESLKNNPNCHLITVDRNNRNKLLPEILKEIIA